MIEPVYASKIEPVYGSKIGPAISGEIESVKPELSCTDDPDLCSTGQNRLYTTDRTRINLHRTYPTIHHRSNQSQPALKDSHYTTQNKPVLAYTERTRLYTTDRTRHLLNNAQPVQDHWLVVAGAANLRGVVCSIQLVLEI